jgi:hypothetical protein
MKEKIKRLRGGQPKDKRGASLWIPAELLPAVKAMLTVHRQTNPAKHSGRAKPVESADERL